jgi:hypothetical protein
VVGEAEVDAEIRVRGLVAFEVHGDEVEGDVEGYGQDGVGAGGDERGSAGGRDPIPQVIMMPLGSNGRSPPNA